MRFLKKEFSVIARRFSSADICAALRLLQRGEQSLA
jgi:hypothetical protein